MPSGFKKARVKPLYKKGSRLDVGNYRPVSILPVMSKILERIVNDQLNCYLKKRNLLYDFQSGFRQGFSTETCLVNLSDSIKTQTVNGNFTGMVLIDLQKAFDCVDHSILLKKLSTMGVSSTDWFRSYLGDRFQCTQVAGIDSDFLPVNCGVPQGSILGPTLFLCYINDMSYALRCKLSLYADDSALLFSGPDPTSVAQFLSQELKTCQKWLIDNRLSLHLGKTECILFGPRRRLTSDLDFKVELDSVAVNRVTSVKYLGVHLDQFLDFSTHVDTIIKKAVAKLSFLYRNGHLLNVRIRRLLCQTLIFSGLEYCASSWYYSISCQSQERLNVVQRKCARFVRNVSPRSHIGNAELSSLSWLTFPRRINFFSLVHAYKVKHGLSPSYLASNFECVQDVHRHNLRQSSVNFSLAHCSSPPGSFVRNTVTNWNSLPANVKGCRSLSYFKSTLKDYLHGIQKCIS